MGESSQPAFIDTASESVDLGALTAYIAEGDVLGVEEAMRLGAMPLLVNPYEWPLPVKLLTRCSLVPSEASPQRIAVMDELVDIVPGIAFLRPPSLLLGLELTREATDGDILSALTDALADSGLSRSSLSGVVVADETTAAAATVLELPVYRATIAELSISGARTALEDALLAKAGSGSTVVLAERVSSAVKLCVARRKPVLDVDEFAMVERASNAYRT